MPSGLMFLNYFFLGFFLLFSFYFFVNNLQYAFICKYCAIDRNVKRKGKKTRKADDEQRKSKESREVLDQILEDFAWKLG